MNTTKRFALSVLGLLVAAQFVFAQTWLQTSAPSNVWTSVASSADGRQFVATASPFNGGDGLIYISTNSGVDWMPTGAPTNSWTAVASSADGTQLIAGALGDLIYVSSNSGADWTPTSAPTNNWNAVASSADGSKLLAAANGDLIYFSTNSGADWTPGNAPTAGWESIACSTDGTKAIAADGNQVWISDDAGATWTQTDLSTQQWNSVCSSANGNELFAFGPSTSFGGHAAPGGFALSKDVGASWTINTNIPSTASGIASSVDGNKLILNGLYVSTNSGATWLQETNLSGPLACSTDGNKIVVAALGTIFFGGHQIPGPGPIYTSFSIPSPSMNIAPANGSFKLSWIVPSTNFVMQQCADLYNWVDVTNPPVLNLTNLNDEVILPSTSGNRFFRLKSP